MKKILLKRPKENFNKCCTYEIFISDKKIVELKNGEEKTVEIPISNSEFLKAKINWCGSKKINLKTINKNDSLEFKGNILFNRYLLILSPLILIIGILIGKYDGMKNLGGGLIILVMILLIGSITIWKNNWIKIE